MEEWVNCTLGDLLTFQRGHDLPKSEMQSGEYPVVGSNGIIGFHNEFTTNEPSVTIGRSGNVGNPFIYYGKTWSHNTTLYVKDFKRNDPVFIYYFLKTMDLSNYAGGSAVPTLNRNHIHTLPIRIPLNSQVQKKIGSLLKLFDDKIAEKILEAEGTIQATVDQFVANVCEEKIGKIIIPEKKNTWSEEVTYKPLSEYVGERFELFLTEKRYDRDGCIASYSSDRKLSAADLLTGQYLEKELGKKVETLIASAKREVEESLINSFEQKLKENLAKDTIERMNIPEVLKRFSEMALEEK